MFVVEKINVDYDQNVSIRQNMVLAKSVYVAFVIQLHIRASFFDILVGRIFFLNFEI